MFTPLFALNRSGIQEVVCYGAVGIIVPSKEIFIPSPQTTIIARSLLKPWQLVACGIYNKGQIPSEKAWIMGAASHFAEDQHIKALEELARITRINPGELQLPGKKEEFFKHPCAGKHILWLWRHIQLQQDPQSYLSSHSLLQSHLAALIQKDLTEPYQWIEDSCGLPALAASLYSQSQLWQKMGCSKEPKWQAFKRHYAENSDLIGGSQRLDTLIMKASRGLLLAKEGADGLLAVTSDFPSGTDGSGFTFLIKLANGYFPLFSALVLLKLLDQYVLNQVPQLQFLYKSLEDFTAKAIGRGQSITFFF